MDGLGISLLCLAVLMYMRFGEFIAAYKERTEVMDMWEDEEDEQPGAME